MSATQRVSMISCAADGADAFARFGFEADLLGLDAEDVGDALAHHVDVCGQLRAVRRGSRNRG